jgi:hypothetical protein
MTTRTEEKEEEEPRSGGPDHFVVSARSTSFFVSTRMAAHIEACLDARKPSPWIRFVDICGSRVRIHRREIEYLFQSTTEQRAAYRRYNRAINMESKADRDWSEGD